MSLALIMATGLLSCSKDDPKDSLSGWYAFLPSDDYMGQAYHFINSNTVEYYPTISESPRWTGYFRSEELTGPMRGYYIQEGCYHNYTYEVIDNKVYIPMKGTILTINGKTLISEGSALRFTKQ